MPYDLRRAKQVERRMMVDALQVLSLGGFPIADYQYTGFGSVHFVDFVMFHKLLGIDDMLSVEYSQAIKKRVEFNKPYECVRIRIGAASEVIPELSRDKQHILWLDYDSVICGPQLEDVWLSASTLSRGSILVVTVDVEPPTRSDDKDDWFQYFSTECASYLGMVDSGGFAKSQLPNINKSILSAAIHSGLSGRADLEFSPLFAFLYADGHSMLTIGGMLTGSSERSRITASRLSSRSYYRASLASECYRITVPVVTRKERLYLDNAMPCKDGWSPKEFELSPQEIEAYREVYRFFPAYAELLL